MSFQARLRVPKCSPSKDKKSLTLEIEKKSSVILLMVQKSSKLTSWGWSFSPIIYRGFQTSQVGFSPDFGTINSTVWGDSQHPVDTGISQFLYFTCFTWTVGSWFVEKILRMKWWWNLFLQSVTGWISASVILFGGAKVFQLQLVWGINPT